MALLACWSTRVGGMLNWERFWIARNIVCGLTGCLFLVIPQTTLNHRRCCCGGVCGVSNVSVGGLGLCYFFDRLVFVNSGLGWYSINVTATFSASAPVAIMAVLLLL